jgi:hypothetical protein
VNELAIGAAAGAAATVPMTWAMETLHRLLPPHERYPLPPREISDRVTEEAGVRQQMDEREQFWLALASHVGYGTAAGAVYAPLARACPGSSVVKGVAYGLAVWAGSYLGLLPALGILSPATRHPVRRTALMIAAHVVWGSALGVFTDLLEKGRQGEGLHSFEERPFRGGEDDEHARRERIPHPTASA